MKFSMTGQEKSDLLIQVTKDNTKQNENISNDESLISLQRLILIELRKSVDGKFEHLLILDDVTEETKHSCKKLKESLLKLEVKIIVAEPNPCNVSFPLHLCFFSVVEIPPPHLP
jgi:hypothetical protein